MVEKKTTKKVVKSEKTAKKPVKAAAKKEVKKPEIVKEENLAEKSKEVIENVALGINESRKYFYAVGKRKTSVAQVKIYPTKENDAKILVNGKEVSKYFPILRLSEKAKEALTVSGKENDFEVVAKVCGGGVSSQAEAVRLGVARALIKFDENLRRPLKDRGLLTRDARKVERKKPGLKKARRSPQWAKR